jgi:hypothetical protein
MLESTLKRPCGGLSCCLLLCMTLGAKAATAMDCLPPIPPAPVHDAATRKAYADEIRNEFHAYFREAQSYLHCLEDARRAVTSEVNKAIADYRALGPAPDD